MPYKDRLNKWLVVRLLPNMQRITVAHFFKHSDADGYLRIIRQLIPKAKFVIRSIFLLQPVMNSGHTGNCSFSASTKTR